MKRHNRGNYALPNRIPHSAHLPSDEKADGAVIGGEGRDHRRMVVRPHLWHCACKQKCVILSKSCTKSSTKDENVRSALSEALCTRTTRPARAISARSNTTLGNFPQCIQKIRRDKGKSASSIGAITSKTQTPLASVKVDTAHQLDTPC